MALPEQTVATWSHHLKCRMVIWGKGVLKSAIQDVGSIITKYKEQCTHMMQAQILMAQLATISIEAKLKTIDGQYKNLLSFLGVAEESFSHTGPLEVHFLLHF